MVPSGLLDGCGVIRIAVQRIDELSETCHHLAKGGQVVLAGPIHQLHSYAAWWIRF